ncbi:unnamed protein product, partial [Brachionus calyciflorus]
MFDKLKRLFVFIIGVYLFYKYYPNHFYSYENQYFSECNCNNSDSVKLYRSKTGNFFVSYTNKSYEIDLQSHVFTCDIYSSLKRGPNQKVISFCLFGNSKRFYYLLLEIAEKVKYFYPDHLIRIYHNSSLDKTFKCELECSKNFVDFCNINKLPISIGKINTYLNVDYLNSRMWRFLPVGDTFVDLFHSRDSDSIILQREKDSVEEWLKTDHIVHIMRDHPAENWLIQAGMWGFKTSHERKLANQLFDQLINKTIAKRFNHDGMSLNKFADQSFLAQYLYPKIHKNATIHDSFTCKIHNDSKPFPTRRAGSCYVGVIGKCNENIEFWHKCPIECRPKDHLNWE